MSNNSAAMREALEAVRDLLLPQCNGGTAFAKACGETVNKIVDALSAPPRNCDVGTANEQAERFLQFCRPQNCKKCKVYYKRRNTHWCQLEWAQMPYKKRGAK
ncbi:MAG: hypothetical protein IKJ89_09445 [Kiritimatiellae bacterium]|nr:hypothetical protein [Kiritimatiellia bacterium]